MAQADPMFNGFDLSQASVPISAIERGGPPARVKVVAACVTQPEAEYVERWRPC